jgi:hypothetical protein
VFKAVTVGTSTKDTVIRSYCDNFYRYEKSWNGGENLHKLIKTSEKIKVSAEVFLKVTSLDTVLYTSISTVGTIGDVWMDQYREDRLILSIDPSV